MLFLAYDTIPFELSDAILSLCFQAPCQEALSDKAPHGAMPTDLSVDQAPHGEATKIWNARLAQTNRRSSRGLRMISRI